MTNNLLLVLVVVLAIINVVILVRLFSGKSSGHAEQAVRSELREGRDEAAKRSHELREEVSGSLDKTAQTLASTMSQLGNVQKQQLEGVTTQVQALVETNQQRLEGLRATIGEQLNQIREANEKKLEEMRRTVDEKLQGTLEKRLGESFKLVSDRLDAVHKGLGEMQSLATGVGDLKNVLTNVKVRGTWAEYQLEAILEQILTRDQFDRNVATREDSAERVEFAIRLPGRSDDPNDCVWLPIDSKFPQEDYLRLTEAAQSADAEAVAQSTRELLRSVTQSAKTIAEKYLKDGDTVFPIARGIGPTPIPRPEKQYYAFGSRISTREYEGKTDEETLWEVRNKVEMQLELDITRMRIKKLEDGDGHWLRSLLNSL